MYKASIVLVLLISFLSVCSSTTLEHVEELQHYESEQNGYWPMPGASIENTGWSDMAKLDFDNAAPKQLLTNDEGFTRSPPVMDRSGFVYTVQRTNDTVKHIDICTIECYNPAKRDEYLWTRDLPAYPIDGPCDQALIAFNSPNSFITLVDGHLYIFNLNQNTSQVPNPTLPHMLGYTSSLLIPLTEHYFLVDDIVTRELHVIYYFFESNCTNSSSNSNCSSDPMFIDRQIPLQSDPSHSPAAHFVQSAATATGLQDPPTLHLFTAEDNTLYAYNVETYQVQWNVTLPTPHKFMSNVVVATGTGLTPIIFVLVITNTVDSQIMLLGFDLEGTQKYSQSLYNPGGEERKPGRLSVDLTHHTVIVMLEQAPANDTMVFAYTYTEDSLKSRNLEEANFQGPVSVDWEGKYYVVTSQYSGYLVLSSEDLSTVDRVLNTSGGEMNRVNRNYAALADGMLVVTGSNGVVGFAQPVDNDSSSNGNHHKLVIILLCVFGGLVAIVVVLAVGGLLYNYYNKNKKQGYEQI